MKLNKHLIICTCTVKPKVYKLLKRNDPTVRLQDYVMSLINLYVLLKDISNVDMVIVENSGSIDLIKQEMLKIEPSLLTQNKVSFIAGRIDKVSRFQGISAGEHLMLNDVLHNSNLYAYDYIWKLSGRLQVDNLLNIVLKADSDIVANRFFTTNHVFDSRLFGMSFRVFDDFARRIPIYTTQIGKLDAKTLKFTSIELYLAQYSLKIENCGLKVKGLAEIPIYRGTSASTGKKLDTPKSLFAIRISNLVRRIAIKSLIGIGP